MSSVSRAPLQRGIFSITHAVIHAVSALCWLGLLAALCALPVVYAQPQLLLPALAGDAPGTIGSGLLVPFAIGLLCIAVLLGMGVLFLRQLRRFVRTIRAGHPFTSGNVLRLQRMAWLMLCMETLSVFIGLYANWMGPGFAWMEVGGGMSITGLIAVLMLFVMAKVFAVGADMREDLEQTI